MTKLNLNRYQKFENLLRELKETSELSIAEVMEERGGRSERYLVFLMGKETFALPVKQLQEVLLNKLIVPVPGAPPSVHGVVNYMNRIISVTNMHHLFQIPYEKGENTFLLVTPGIDSESGILVDALLNLIPVDQKEIKPKISGQNEFVNRLTRGEIYCRERLVTLLDLNGFD